MRCAVSKDPRSAMMFGFGLRQIARHFSSIVACGHWLDVECGVNHVRSQISWFQVIGVRSACPALN
jgi:hypothetical protein